LTGLENVVKAFESGEKANKYTKAAAQVIKAGIEEIKTQSIGMPAGTGLGFYIAGATSPVIDGSVKNVVFNMIKNPVMITSAMQMSKVTEAGARSILEKRDFDDVLNSTFEGGAKQIGAEFLSNLIFMGKSIKPNEYTKLEEMAKKDEASGDIASATFIRAQVDLYRKMDKASAYAEKKGKAAGLSEEEIIKNMRQAQEDAAKAGQGVYDQTLENANVLERIIPENQVSTVLRNTKMVDEKGDPQVWYHGTDKMFNRFSKIPSPSTGRMNQRNRDITFFANT